MIFDKFSHNYNLSQNFYVDDLNNVILNYIGDDKKKWQMNNHKLLMDDIKSLNKLIEYSWLIDIGQTISDFIGTDIFDHNRFNDCMIEIENRAFQYCKKCRRHKNLYFFESIYATCSDCRKSDKEKRFRNKIIESIWYMNANQCLYYKFKIINDFHTISCILKMIASIDEDIQIINYSETKKYYNLLIGRRINY